MANWVQRQGAVSQAPPMSMPFPIWQVLSGRGFTDPLQIENLLQPKLKDLAHPFSLDQMDRAVERLVAAFKVQEKILLYADYDLDGTPGLALLHQGLQSLGFLNLSVFQPSRAKDGYGVHAHKLQEFAAVGGKLVITVDVGITDVEAVAVGNRCGLDVIITDHHLPKGTLPAAYAIVNPNKGSCTSRLQHLCGTGVAFYLVLALRMEMTKQKLLASEFNPKDLLDLFAIATITDMVPLIAENRVLVKHGLKVLAATTRPGLKKLFQELGFYGRQLSAQDIAFRVAPKLNALTRLEEGITAWEVITADESTAGARVQEALIINRRRVEFQEKARKIVDGMVDKNAPNPFVFIYSHEFHPGIISLLANDLMSQYQVPAFVGSLRPDGRVLGSARAPSKAFHLQEVLTSVQDALEKFGGHQLAAGFEVRSGNTDKLKALLGEYFAKPENWSTRRSDEEVFYDTEARIRDLDSTFMNWYENMGPYGMQFEAPVLRINQLRVSSVKKIKGNFYKYQLTDGFSRIDAPWFSGAQEFLEGTILDVLCEPQWNEYQGRRSIQIHLKSARPH